MLIIFAGLPGAGKTTIARELARRLGAVHVRIDSIEQAIGDCRATDASLNEAGYRVGYAVAADNLRLGLNVIADSVNPLRVTRNAWVEVARRVQTNFVEIEVICSDTREHRKRIETRTTDIPGLRTLTWQDVTSRDCDVWERKHLVLDTALQSVDECIGMLLEATEARKE